MRNMYILAEGQTEVNFIKRVLYEHFSRSGVNMIPITVTTKTDKKQGKMHKGGISNFAKIEAEIKKIAGTINDSADNYLSTMIDFYKYPSDSPDYNRLNILNSPYDKVKHLEKELKKTAQKYLVRDSFIPYVQLHEFETLIFSDLSKLAEKYFDKDIKKLQSDVAGFANPELINNGETTAPSKRIISYIPNYDKAGMGVTIAENIGLDVLKQTCQHFGEWITSMETIR